MLEKGGFSNWLCKSFGFLIGKIQKFPEMNITWCRVKCRMFAHLNQKITKCSIENDALRLLIWVWKSHGNIFNSLY